MPHLRCIDVHWKHSNTSDPVRLISAIGADGYEAMKVEVYRDGSIGYATESSSYGDTELGASKVPPLAEILSQPEFTGKEVSAEEFQKLWREFVTKM